MNTLKIASLLTIVLFSFHWTDDVVRGFAPGGFSSLAGVLILVTWLYGTLVLGERRSGQVIMLLGSILGLYALLLHLRGAGLVGGRIANSSGVFFWVWTLLAFGVTSSFCMILSLSALVRPKPGTSAKRSSLDETVVTAQRGSSY